MSDGGKEIDVVEDGEKLMEGGNGDKNVYCRIEQHFADW